MENNPQRELIAQLGYAPFSQDPDTLYHWVESLANSDKGSARAVQDCIELILSTRTRLTSDPDLDVQLTTAAGNAISILNYGAILSRLPFDFLQVKDWSHCRIPNANLNMAVLAGCNFDYADLTGATLYCAYTYGASFRHAILTGATTYEHILAPCQPASTGTIDLVAAFSPDTRTLAIVLGEEGEGCDVTVMDVQSYGCLATLSHNACVKTLAYALDGRTLAVALQNKPTLYIWDITTSTLTHQLHGHLHVRSKL